MRTTFFAACSAIAVLAVLLIPEPDRAQPPGAVKLTTTKPPPDEFRALVREIEEAYKAPFEVDKDIQDELRKQYKNPTPEREGKIFREIRRLYNLTPDQEQDITRELRRGYEQQSPEQEERIFRAIRRNGRLPEGTVPLGVQVEQAGKLFRGFDRDADGRLSSDEMPDTLRAQSQRWDANRDGFIDFAEYGSYYQAHLRSVSDRVASGEISIKLPKAASMPPPNARTFLAPVVPQAPAQAESKDSQPVAIRYGKLPSGLPDWFVEYDTNRDGQVALFEWRQQKLSMDEFVAMDLDGDFLITPKELLRVLAEQAKERPAESTPTRDKPAKK